jgi:hypothetical protein
MDSKMQTDMIVLDFAKAFDKVSHPRLLHKLRHYGIKGKNNQWITASDIKGHFPFLFPYC